MDEQITLDYGSGGQKTADLIQSILLPLLTILRSLNWETARSSPADPS